MATAAKAPQDRKAKKGFYRIDGKDYELKADLVDDYEFLELTRESADSFIKMVDCLKYVFADESGYAALKEACRENGRVSTDAMGDHFQAIMEAAAPNS